MMAPIIFRIMFYSISTSWWSLRVTSAGWPPPPQPQDSAASRPAPDPAADMLEMFDSVVQYSQKAHPNFLCIPYVLGHFKPL